MIATLASILNVIYTPTMWFMMALCVLLGLLAFLAPDRLRGTVSIFTQLGPARVLGVILLLVGAEIFVWASRAAMSVLVRTLGVAFFIAGGVCLLVPVLAVILSEKMAVMPSRYYRILGFLFLGLAVLFYVAQVIPVAGSQRIGNV